MNAFQARIFLALFAILAILPLFQELFHPIKLAGLQGAFEDVEKPQLNFKTWISGDYQQTTDKYVKHHTAFNGELVRLRNQVDYSVFGNINTLLTLGKENYLFDPNYINALEGSDLLTDSVKENKLLAIKSTLKILDSLNIKLIVCFAPNKARFFSEYLTEMPKPGEFTNKSTFDSMLTAEGVSMIDYDSWFLKMKDTSSFPLVPKYGAHWSTYGAYLAADSLLNQFEATLGKPVSDFKATAFQPGEKPKYTDDDYLASLNLMVKWKSPAFVYPELVFNPKYKPNVLFISDSFIWNFYDLGVVQNCLDEKSEAIYYFKSRFDFQKNPRGPLEPFNTKDLRGRDFIVILSSDPSLTDFGFGFFELISTMRER